MIQGLGECVVHIVSYDLDFTLNNKIQRIANENNVKLLVNEPVQCCGRVLILEVKFITTTFEWSACKKPMSSPFFLLSLTQPCSHSPLFD